MRLVYFILVVNCLFTGSLRCLCELQPKQTEPKENAAHDNGQKAEEKSDQQTVSHSSNKPSLQQQLPPEEKPHAAASHSQDQAQSQEVEITKNGKGSELEDLPVQNQKAETATETDQQVQGNHVEESPKVSADEDLAGGKKEDLTKNHIVSPQKDSSPAVKSQTENGKEEKSSSTQTPPSVSKHSSPMLQPDPITVSPLTASHSVSVEDVSVGSTATPDVVVPAATVVPESISPSVTEQPSQETQSIQPPPSQDQPPEPSKDKTDSVLEQLPLPTGKPQPLAEGSGGMVVEDPDLTQVTHPAEEEGEGVKKLTDDIQTFGEWRKKVLEEEEKENEKVKQMAKEGSNGEAEATAVVSSQKLRVNYASEKCGAKIISCNPEMENGNHMLTANKDEYMINPCSAKKWFVVELCEPISVKTVEIASMELFSSQPRSFRISLTDRYPTKEWVTDGPMEMKADKVPQLFSLNIKSPFVKFVRVEMLDHYGSEHFCPVTLFRVFGVPMEDDDDDNVHHHTESEDEQGDGNAQTLFARTKETVVSLVKKVLYKDNDPQQQQTQGGEEAVERHANISGDTDLPCDPDLENQRLPEKKIQGTPVTVHHPQPTINVAQDVSSSTSSGEVPMVTKLNDGEQQEIEEKAKTSSQGGQDLVVLLQPSGWRAWQRVLHYCDSPVNHSSHSCHISQKCLYVEALLGTPAPISHSKWSVSVSPWPSDQESSTASMSQNLEPSFTSSVFEVDPVERVASAKPGRTYSTDIHVEPSSELSKESPSSSSQATTRIPSNTPLHSISTASTASTPSAEEESQLPKGTGKAAADVLASDEESLRSPITSSKVVPSSPNGQIVETDPQDTGSTAGVTSDSGTAVPTASVESSKQATVTEDTATDRSVGESATDILQPSIELDTTSVISPTLTRPTPVLEMSGASVSMQESKGSVIQTVHPSLSPSPTSDTAEAAQGQLESAVFPQVIEPTMEEPKAVPSSEVPGPPQSSVGTSSDSATVQKQEAPAVTQNATDMPAKKNDTEKKGAELGLVTVPLSLSAKRESAIMRLTNRIKALELNVSLSSRFLEELSTRFKKQNEEMMKMLNKTMNKLNSTATSTQRQMAVQEQRIDQLETRLDNLTEAVQRLADRFDTFAQQMSDRQMTFTTLNLILLVVSLVLCCRALQSKPLHPDLQFLLETMPRHPPPCSPFPRRNSDVALPVSHNPDLAMGSIMKKGGSVANLNVPMEGGSLLPLDKPDLGPKKKKRKKNKPQKAGSVDAESIGGAESDSGLKMSSRDTRSEGGSVSQAEGHGEGGRETEWRGHRRWGSASASFCLLEEPTRTRSDSGKEVQFCIGGSTIHTNSADRVSKQVTIGTNSAPSLCTVSTCKTTPAPVSATSINAKPPLPRNQRSKSLSTPPHDLVEDRPILNSVDVRGQEGEVLPCGRKDHPPVSGEQASDSGTQQSPWDQNIPPNSSAVPRVPALARPKKPLTSIMSTVNGERENKGPSYEQGHTSQRKGSFRSGAVGEEGSKGISGKAKGGKKPGRGPAFEKA